MSHPNPYLKAALREQDALRPKPGKAADAADYGTWKVADLKAEIARRNAERGLDLPSTGKRDDLAAVLADDDTNAPAPSGAEEEAGDPADTANTSAPKE
jgi:hypothetical protein